MSIQYCTKLPSHISSEVVGRLTREWRAEFDASLDWKAKATEAAGRRYRAENEMKALLIGMKVQIGDVLALHHGGVVTMVSLEEGTETYSRGEKRVVFRHAKNLSQTDNKDEGTEAGRIASEWIAAKADEEAASAGDSGLSARLQAIEQRLLKHINGKLPHEWEESIFLTYLHADGWAAWVNAYKSFGIGEWKIGIRFSTLIVDAKASL